MTINNNQEEQRKGFSELIIYLFAQFNLGKTNDQIINELISNGMKQEDAESAVEVARKMHSNYPNETDNLRRHIAAQKGKRRMWTGGFWFVVGSLITWATYSEASSSSVGGTYVICYGAIALGAIYFFWGLFEWTMNSSSGD